LVAIIFQRRLRPDLTHFSVTPALERVALAVEQLVPTSLRSDEARAEIVVVVVESTRCQIPDVPDLMHR